MGKRGGRDLQLVLQTPDRHTGLAGANQGAVDFQPRRIAEGFEMGSGVIEFS